MKVINYDDYNPSMGQIIDIEDNLTYQDFHLPGAINIPYYKLLYHYKEYLDVTKNYYLYCLKGVTSRKVASILEFYGYKVGVIKK